MVAQSNIEPNMNFETSVIQKFYEGGRVFITGGTGFLGNLLIQKLIRDCPGISKLYLLVRTKKGKSPEQRLEEILKDPVFNKMKSEQPNYADKIKLMSGDLEQPMLGLNEEDIRTLEQEVNLVFHVAATVRFDEKIKKAAAINVRATKDVIHVAKNMPNLRAYIHVSTAYSHCYRKEIGEELYDVPMDPDRLLEITQQLDDEELEVLTPKWIGNWPNTYSYTKAMAEKMVEKYGGDLPIGIVRPSIVIPTVKDPEAGWINNFYGPVGLSMATGAGVTRVVRVNKDNICELVPGDYVTNSMIVAAQNVATTFNKNLKKSDTNNIEFDELQNTNQIKIFNYVSSNENFISWQKYKDYAMEIYEKYVPMQTMWHPFLFLVNSAFAYKILAFLLHTIPAHIVDFILLALGKKPIFVKLYPKIDKFSDTLSYFSTQQWKFNNDNLQALWNNLNQTDKRIFEFSMTCLRWEKYFDGFGKGFRIYLFKDPLDTLPQAKRRGKMLKYAHYTVVTMLLCMSMLLVYRIVELVL